MWFRDLDGTPAENASTIAEFFDCSEETAERIAAECTRRHDRGDQGLAYGTGSERNEIHGYDLSVTDERKLLREIQASLNTPTAIDRFGGVDASDLAQLFRDAWIDGIQRKDRVLVQLNSDTDGVCCMCYACVASHENQCGHCGSTDIGRNVMVEVWDEFAGLWADNDQSIEGSSWESADGPDFVYTIIGDHAELVDDLRAEGYKLDLSAYESVEFDR